MMNYRPLKQNYFANKMMQKIRVQNKYIPIMSTTTVPYGFLAYQ